MFQLVLYYLKVNNNILKATPKSLFTIWQWKLV